MEFRNKLIGEAFPPHRVDILSSMVRGLVYQQVPAFMNRQLHVCTYVFRVSVSNTKINIRMISLSSYRDEIASRAALANSDFTLQ